MSDFCIFLINLRKTRKLRHFWQKLRMGVDLVYIVNLPLSPIPNKRSFLGCKNQNGKTIVSPIFFTLSNINTFQAAGTEQGWPWIQRKSWTIETFTFMEMFPSVPICAILVLCLMRATRLKLKVAINKHQKSSSFCSRNTFLVVNSHHFDFALWSGLYHIYCF